MQNYTKNDTKYKWTDPWQKEWTLKVFNKKKKTKEEANETEHLHDHCTITKDKAYEECWWSEANSEVLFFLFFFFLCLMLLFLLLTGLVSWFKKKQTTTTKKQFF